MKHKAINRFYIFCLSVLLLNGCQDYLSVKSDKKLATPRSSKDLIAVLDYVQTMNMNIANGITTVGSDELYIPDATWNSLAANNRIEYVWDRQPVFQSYWIGPYTSVLNSNMVLEELESMEFENEAEKKQIKGAAFFYRAYQHFHLAQTFAPPFHQTTADLDGIPIRLTADVNVRPLRETVKRTYELIESDLLRSCDLLSDVKPIFPTRPYKASAYAALARLYQSMGEHMLAGQYADSCLQLSSRLLDFNAFEINAQPYPFERFNEEVIFYSEMDGNIPISEAIARIDPSFYGSYTENDMRRNLYFTEKEGGFHAFTGDYARQPIAYKFNGLTTAEMFLIRAESNIRSQLRDKAIADLSHFLNHRYSDVTIQWNEMSDKQLFDFLKDERRKELVFRGLRWIDIRRFSFEEEHAVMLTRTINNQTITLSPLEIQKFAFHIPTVVINAGNVRQNP